MSRDAPIDAQSNLAMKETIAKIQDAQLNFFIKNQNLYSKKGGASAVLRRKIENQTILNDNCDTLTKQAQQRAAEKERKVKIKEPDEDKVDSNIGKLPEDFTLDMHRASPTTLKLLYEGTSHEGFGKLNYLKERTKKGPEEKWDWPMQSSWYYGWRLGDTIHPDKVKKSRFGKLCIIDSTFYTRTGIPANVEKQSRTWYN